MHAYLEIVNDYPQAKPTFKTNINNFLQAKKAKTDCDSNIRSLAHVHYGSCKF